MKKLIDKINSMSLLTESRSFAGKKIVFNLN